MSSKVKNSWVWNPLFVGSCWAAVDGHWIHVRRFQLVEMWLVAGASHPSVLNHHIVRTCFRLSLRDQRCQLNLMQWSTSFLFFRILNWKFRRTLRLIFNTVFMVLFFTPYVHIICCQQLVQRFHLENGTLSWLWSITKFYTITNWCFTCYIVVI